MLKYTTLQFIFVFDTENLRGGAGADVKAVQQTAERQTSSVHGMASRVKLAVRLSNSFWANRENRKQVLLLRGYHRSFLGWLFCFPDVFGKREFDMEETLKKKAAAYFIGPRRHYGDFTDEELVRCVRECVSKNELKERHVAIAIFKALGITPEMLVEQLTWTGEPTLCEEDAIAI